MAEIIEYPKALYKGGEYVSVADKTEEEALRKRGFLDWRADYDRMNGNEEAKTEDPRSEGSKADSRKVLSLKTA